MGNLSSTAPFVVIRLNGLVHSDEKTALREIGRQLYLEYESYKISSRSLSFGHHVQLLLDVLREAHQAGVVTMEPDILRKLLTGSLHWTPTWFRHGGGLSLEDLTDRVWQLATGHRP